jgi:hypothetical protein
MNSNTIKTFDGKDWNKENLLEQMRSDSFYYGYMGKNSLSSSSIGKLLKSPRVYVNSLTQNDKSSALEFGTLFHLACLEPEKFDEQIFVDAKDRRSKDYKDAVKENEGQPVYLEKDRDIIVAYADRFYNNTRVTEVMKATQKEIPAVGYIDGLPFRGKADALGEGYVVDLKTTSKDLTSWRYSAYSYNYDAQCYIYSKLFGIDPINFIYVVMNSMDGTLAIVDGVSTNFYESGRSKVHRACSLFKDYFLEKNHDLDEYILEIDL